MEHTEKKLHDVFQCTLTLLNHNAADIGHTRSIDPLRDALRTAIDELDGRIEARRAAVAAKALLREMKRP